MCIKSLPRGAPTEQARCHGGKVMRMFNIKNKSAMRYVIKRETTGKVGPREHDHRITIKVESAKPIQQIQPHIICHKGPLSQVICLTDKKRTGMQVIIILIPLPDNIVRTMTAPAPYTFFCEFWLWFPPKPAIMDHFGYWHELSPLGFRKDTPKIPI